MVGYEMLAQAQRDLTAEQVSNKLNVGSESGYHIYSVFISQIETLTSIRLRADIHTYILYCYLPKGAFQDQ